MAGLEYVVRPAIFPNIRPTPNQSVPQKDDPNQGKAVITGSSGKTIDLPYSYSISSSESRQTETRRRVDVARVYQMDDNGNVNRDNFVDINVVNKMWMQDGQVTSINHYTPVRETDNIQVRERNKIIRSDQ